MEAMPIPNPPISRKLINTATPSDNIQPIVENINRTADHNNPVFLPYLSLKLPAIATPIIQPNRAELTNHPSIAEDIENSSLTKRTTPEITAVSKPNKKPPIATTEQIIVMYVKPDNDKGSFI